MKLLGSGCLDNFLSSFTDERNANKWIGRRLKISEPFLRVSLVMSFLLWWMSCLWLLIPSDALDICMYSQNSLMGSPIVAGRIASPGSQSPSSLPYDVPSSYGSGNGVTDKNRTRSITEASTSRGPVSKVMDMFRNRSQSVSSDDKRKVMDNFRLNQSSTLIF